MRALLFFCFAAIASAAASPELTISSPTFHEYENGPILAKTFLFKPGDWVFVSLQVSGFKTAGEDEDQVKLSYEAHTTDSGGRLIAEGKTGKIETSLAPEDKKRHWLPKIKYSVQLPSSAAAGNYMVHITVRDEIGNVTTQRAVGFNVGGSAAVDTSAGLSVQNFQLMRSERDNDLLPEGGSYRRGDPVWTRFDIAGFRYGLKNKYDLTYGVTVQDPTGRVVFEDPNAAHLSEETFYPVQAVPGGINIKLDAKNPPGNYTLTLHVTDAIAAQSIDSAHQFKIE